MKNTSEIRKTFMLGRDMEINRIGYGAMRITGPKVWGMPEDPQNSINILRRAVELDVNFIDTADQYGPFISEQLIGDALYPYQDNVIVGTKGGLIRFGPWADILNDASPQHLHEALNGSLKRLKLERVDLYQLHRIDPRIPVELTFAFLKQAQKEGRIRHLGLSEVSVDEIKKAQEYFEVVSVQNRYSIDNRTAEPVLEYCRQNNIAFIPWFPMGVGDFKGKDTIQLVADRHQASVHQIALSWLLHHSDNIVLIPGTSSLAHLEENMKIGTITLSEQDMRELDRVGL